MICNLAGTLPKSYFAGRENFELGESKPKIPRLVEFYLKIVAISS
jgi:hypothetical protein